MQPGKISFAGFVAQQHAEQFSTGVPTGTKTSVLAGFDSVSLEEMDGVALLNRVDTKYVFRREDLVQFLSELQSDYQILEIDGLRRARYRTQYWDTEDLSFYHLHHNGKKNRTKVRFREYEDSGLVYLEVKNKSNKGRTDKSRLRVESFQDSLSRESLSFIRSAAGELPELRPALANYFKRITLVNKNLPERFTLDFDITFEEEKGAMEMGHLVIGELKQSKASRNSKAATLFKSLGVRPMSISKYCLGSALLNPALKSNNFKEKLRYIEKL